MLTPLEATTAGLPGSKPVAVNCCHHLSPASKSTGTSRSQSGTPKPSAIRTPPPPGLGTWLVDLEYLKAGGNLRSALGEGVKTSPKDNTLTDAATRLFRDEILDEARPGHDGSAKEPREPRVHVRAMAPPAFWGHQLETDFIFEHVRRRIDLDVRGPPQGHPHRCAVRRYAVLIAGCRVHVVVLIGAWSFQMIGTEPVTAPGPDSMEDRPGQPGSATPQSHRAAPARLFQRTEIEVARADTGPHRGDAQPAPTQSPAGEAGARAIGQRRRRPRSEPVCGLLDQSFGSSFSSHGLHSGLQFRHRMFAHNNTWPIPLGSRSLPNWC